MSAATLTSEQLRSDLGGGEALLTELSDDDLMATVALDLDAAMMRET